jgi:ribonuclease HI
MDQKLGTKRLENELKRTGKKSRTLDEAEISLRLSCGRLEMAESHAGHEQNERCDSLVQAEIRKQASQP